MLLTKEQMRDLLVGGTIIAFVEGNAQVKGNDGKLYWLKGQALKAAVFGGFALGAPFYDLVAEPCDNEDWRQKAGKFFSGVRSGRE